MHKEKAPVYVWLDEHPSLRIPKGKVPGGRNVSVDKGVVLRESGVKNHRDWGKGNLIHARGDAAAALRLS